MSRNRLLPALLLICAAARGGEAGLFRRAVGPSPRAGWVKVVLDGPAQRERDSLWLGDGDGRPVPFLWAPEGPRNSRPVPLSRVLLGKDAAGRPTAEFSVKLPPGWHKGDAEELTIGVESLGGSPWACRVEVLRRQDDGAFLALDLNPPPVLYDFGASGSGSTLTLPWDGERYRLTLVPVSGVPPVLRSVSVEAATRATAEWSEVRITPRREPLPTLQGQPRRGMDVQPMRGSEGQTWRLSWEAPERVVGLEVLLEPPAAPLLPGVSQEGEALSTSGLVWNLPALGTAATHVAAGPFTTASLDLTLPEGARLKSVEILVRREVLVFPAEAGRTYYLHGGGGVRKAPGTLEGLPGAGAEGPASLVLGPSEPDPQGIPRLLPPGTGARAWLPWAAGAVALLLGFTALRLFTGPKDQ